MTSITPFGQTGDYKSYKASDIVAMAMSGMSYMSGDPERPPVRIPVPQAYLHAGAAAAEGTMIAHWHRMKTGEGQHVDISTQQATILCQEHSIFFWEYQGIILQRTGAYRSGLSAKAQQRQLYPCKNGYVLLAMFGGKQGATTNRGLTEWMDSEGMGDEFMKAMDWDNFSMAETTQDTWNHIQEVLGPFFLAHTKEELWKGAVEREIMLCPVNTTEDIVNSEQLKARKFWVALEHPELGRSLKYPGPFAKMSETPLKLERHAPLIGEHNQEIYQGELGLSAAKIATLKKSGVV